MQKQVNFGMEENKLIALKHRLVDKGLSMTMYLNRLIEQDRIADKLKKSISIDSLIDGYEEVESLMTEDLEEE